MTEDYVVLSASAREVAGSSAANRLRKGGKWAPGVIYVRQPAGPPERVYISVDSRQLLKEYLKKHVVGRLFWIEVDGTRKMVVLYDIVLHPVTRAIMHVEFNEVVDGIVLANVPVVFCNHDSALPTKRGAFLNILRRTISMTCDLKGYREKIMVDLKDAAIGQSYRVADLPLPTGHKLRRCAPNDLVARFMGKRSAPQQSEAAPSEAKTAAKGSKK